MANKLLVYTILNFSGVIYTSVIIIGLAALDLLYACPALLGADGCRVYVGIAVFILAVCVFCV